jgi:hypothetical protein
MKTLVKVGLAAAAVIGVGALACYGFKRLVEKAALECDCCNCDDDCDCGCNCDCHIDDVKPVEAPVEADVFVETNDVVKDNVANIADEA